MLRLILSASFLCIGHVASQNVSVNRLAIGEVLVSNIAEHITDALRVISYVELESPKLDMICENSIEVPACTGPAGGGTVQISADKSYKEHSHRELPLGTKWTATILVFAFSSCIIFLVISGCFEKEEYHSASVESQSGTSHHIGIEVVNTSTLSNERDIDRDIIQVIFDDEKSCIGYLGEDGTIFAMPAQIRTRNEISDDEIGGEVERDPPSYSYEIATTSWAAQGVEVRIILANGMGCKGIRQSDGSVRVISGAIPPPPYEVGRTA